MTAHRIKQVALVHFAEYGYEGTSLSKIAQEVGIKKPSIYAHFKSKEDLFMQILQDAFKLELDVCSAFFQEHQGQRIAWQLKTYLYNYLSRYQQQDELRFMLRMTFCPPAPVEEAVLTQVYHFLDNLEHHLVPIIGQALRNGEIAGIHPEQAATAFMCMLDGLFAELLYGGEERFKRKLEASWLVYWRGLTLQADNV